MTETAERTCLHCKQSEETETLERCRYCYGHFCSDCAHRVRGARFCSERCGLEYIYGDSETDDDLTTSDEE